MIFKRFLNKKRAELPLIKPDASPINIFDVITKDIVYNGFEGRNFSIMTSEDGRTFMFTIKAFEVDEEYRNNDGGIDSVKLKQKMEEL